MSLYRRHSTQRNRKIEDNVTRELVDILKNRLL